MESEQFLTAISAVSHTLTLLITTTSYLSISHAYFFLVDALDVVRSIIDAENVNHFLGSSQRVCLTRKIDNIMPMGFVSKVIFHTINVSLQPNIPVIIIN